MRDPSSSTAPVMVSRSNSPPSCPSSLCNSETLDNQSMDADSLPIGFDIQDDAFSVCLKDDSTEDFFSFSSVYRSSRTLSVYYNPRWSSPWWSDSRGDQSSNSCFGVDKVEPNGVGAGLTNLGNTCFLNAILQCITHTVEFVESLRSLNHLTPCDSGDNEFCVICAFREHIELSLSSSGRVISPTKFAHNLKYFSASFIQYQQEDAHEFLQCLLDKLERCCLDSTSNDTTYSYPNNLVKRVFGGHLISELKCCNCGHCSINHEPLIDLSLEIEDVETLSSALQSFTKVEKITKFICNNCKKEVSLEKQLMLEQAPSVAAFHLKRFKADGCLVEKIDKHVEFPLELDLSQYTSGSLMNNVALKYNLYAIVVHSGDESTSGHYYSFIRSSPDIWHKLNDSMITKVEEESVLSLEAYILFYARQDTPWFSTLIEEKSSSLKTKEMSPQFSTLIEEKESRLKTEETSPDSVLDKTKYILDQTVANVDSCQANESGDESRNDSSVTEEDSNKILEESWKDKFFHRLTPPNLTTDASEGITMRFSAGSKQDIVVFDESRNGSSLTKNICSTSSPDIKDSNKILAEASIEFFFHCLTSPRSPNPDNSIQPREEGERRKVSCRRPPNKALENEQRRESYRYIKNSNHVSKRSKMLAAMLANQNEGKRKKKRRRLSQKNKVSSRRTRR